MDPREQAWAAEMRAERQGDKAAYERLLKDIADLLRRLTRSRLARLGLSTQEAEDLVQEVLIGLHTKRHTWEADRPFLPWLHAIIRYKVIDASRRLKRETRYRIDLIFEEMSELFEALAEDVERASFEIDRHFSDLSRGQVFVLIGVRPDLMEFSVRPSISRLLPRCHWPALVTSLYSAPRGLASLHCPLSRSHQACFCLRSAERRTHQASRSWETPTSR